MRLRCHRDPACPSSLASAGIAGLKMAALWLACAAGVPSLCMIAPRAMAGFSLCPIGTMGPSLCRVAALVGLAIWRWRERFTRQSCCAVVLRWAVMLPIALLTPLRACCRVETSDRLAKQPFIFVTAQRAGKGYALAGQSNR